MSYIPFQRIGFIGAGHITDVLLSRLLDNHYLSKDRLYMSNRSQSKLNRMAQRYGINPCKNNEELVDICDMIFLCVKPQDIVEAVEPIAMSFDDSKVIISLAAGIPLNRLSKMFSEAKYIIRLMPNIPCRIGEGVVGYCYTESSEYVIERVIELLKSLGQFVKAEDEESFQSLMVACASGPGFILELMKYWQDWLEDYGFSEDRARDMTVQTFLGTSRWASKDPDKSLEVLQSQVTSRGGVTEAGLTVMREEDVERLLRVSFEKAVMRDKKWAEDVCS